MTLSNIVDGPVGKAYSFNGVDDYVSCPNTSSLRPENVTLLVWLIAEENITGKWHVGKGCKDPSESWDAVSYGIRYFDWHMGSNCEKNDGLNTFAKYDATLNTWYCAVMTFNSTTKDVKYYQVGVLRNTVNHGQDLRYTGAWNFLMAAGYSGAGSGINFWAKCLKIGRASCRERV